MDYLSSPFGAMTSNLLVLVGLTYLVSLFVAAHPSFRTAYRGAMFGTALGAMAVMLMAASVEIDEGTYLDLRYVAAFFAGLLGGPVAAAVACGITVVSRIDLGGSIVVPAIIACTAGALGVIARMLRIRRTLPMLISFGLMLALLRSVAPFIAYWLGYREFASAQTISLTVLPLSIVFFPIACTIMGALLEYEGLRANRAASLRSLNDKLAERDALFQQVFDNSSVAMLWMSDESRILRANKRMSELVGYTPQQLQSMDYEDILPPDERESFYQVRAAQAKGERPQDIERRYLKKGGGIFWGLRSVTRVQLTVAGQFHKFVMIQDITERKQALEHIRFQAELLESVEQAVIATDLSGAITFWNRSAERLYGLSAAEAIGASVADLVPSISEQFQLIDARLATGRSWSGEFSVERQNGATVLVHITNSPVRGHDGSVIGIVAVGTDVTEEKRSRQALMEEQRVLAVLSRMAAALNAGSDLAELMQAVTDAGVEATGAEFAAAFSGERPYDAHFELYALSGLNKDTFGTLSLPREKGLVGPILTDDKVFRWDDVTSDPDVSIEAAGGDAVASAVRSYIAAPLVSRAGKVIGALFLGHSQPRVFTQRTERIIESIAAHAAIAVEKASLFEAAQQEIESRKQVEESLNQSEARFRDFAEVGSDLLWETDEQFRITSIVGDSRAVFGLPEDELLGRTAWEVARADLNAIDWKQHLVDHETRQPFRNFEYQLVDRNGAVRWISANGRPYFSKSGSFGGFRGSSTNIAARKHAETKLAASAHQQQSAAVLSQLALQGVPRDDLYQVAVELVARTLGVELVGILELSSDKRVLRLQAGSGWPAQSVDIRAVPVDYCPPLARGINSDVPVHFSRRNFNLIPGLQNDKGSGVALPIGEKSARLGVLVVCSDGFRAFSESDINFLRSISFVLAADAEQRKAAATLRLRDRALEAIGEGIMITDAAEFDNPVIYVNPAFERLTGYSNDEVTGRNARFLQGEETDKATIHEIHSVVDSESVFRGSILNYRKDGTTFWNGLTITPIRDPNGATSHFVGVVTDETERIQLASQLRQAQKMEALGHLTGGVAHDFNNLLAVILGNSEILYEEMTDPDLKSTAELVMTTAEKGADLTQRLLAFGRRQALHPESLQLGTVIESLSEMLNRTLGSQVKLETRSGTAKPAHVDRGLFESAILNLAVNARDAMPNGGLLTITTDLVHSDGGRASGLAPGDYVKVTVTDTGQGMPHDVLERAFDPFFTTKGVGKGSGMGLSMVYGFAKQSGGHVSIDSKIGHGTSVHVYLPISEEAAPAAPEARQEVLHAACGNERILLVEDEPHVRRFVSNQLAGLGYSVVEADAGAPALEILRSDDKFDLLFTDLLMPGGMSGFDLVKLAREFHPNLRVLLTTGYAAETDSMLANVREPILKKPYKKQQLAQALRHVFEQAA